MPRDPRAPSTDRHTRAKRDSALKRIELSWPTEPRRSAAGVTSAPVKAEDPALRAMIDAALAKRAAT